MQEISTNTKQYLENCSWEEICKVESSGWRILETV